VLSTLITSFSTLSLHDALPIFVVLVLLREARSHVAVAILNRMVLPHQVAVVVRRVAARAATRRIIPVDDLAAIHTSVATGAAPRSEEHTSELQSRVDLVCRLLL